MWLDKKLYNALLNPFTFIVIVILTFAATSSWSARKYDRARQGWERESRERATKDQQLLVEKTQLESQARELERRAASAETQLAALEQLARERTGADAREVAKLESITEEFNRESATTDQPVDARIRCERLRAKYLAAGIRAASGIDCANPGR